jgi:hypothetical protein
MSQRRPVATAKAPSSSEVLPEIVDEDLSSPGSPSKAVKGSLSLEDEETVPLAPYEDIQEKGSTRAKLKLWLDSPFAAGLTEPTWVHELKYSVRRNAHNDSDDDDINSDTSGCLCCSAIVCPYLGAGRVGNMAVLHSSTEWVEEMEQDEETGEKQVRRFTRPRLNIVVGPYWPMLLFVTYPIIFAVSGWAFVTAILPGKLPAIVVLFWLACTVGLITALAFTGFRDPGILYRHDSPPPQGENTWRWSDQAQSYRPRGAYFDSDTFVIVEDFDHT